MATETHERAIKQADFLNRLSKLMNEFEADFTIEGVGDGDLYILINACGHWIPYHDAGWVFDVDECIKATAATIEHAKDTAPSESAYLTSTNAAIPDATFPEGRK